MTHLEDRRDELVASITRLKVEASEASAVARIAGKDDRVEAARDAATKRADLDNAKRELADVEKEMRAAAKAAKEAAKQAVRAAVEREREERLSLVEENPFLADEVNYPAMSAWMAKRAAGLVCYVDGCGWGEWKGSHWEFRKEASASLLDRVRAQYTDIVSEAVSKLNAGAKSALYILEHAQGALTLPYSLFNTAQHAHLVPFRNVTVDLRTGATMPHNPRHYLTGSLKCDYNPDAKIEKILEAFARFWPNDRETAEMFQTAWGYTLTGETAAKRVMFMVGNQDEAHKNGDNGKSLVQNAFSQLFGLGTGGYGTAVKSGIIVDTGDRDANSHDGAKTPLIWKRFALAAEFRHGSSLDAGEFNSISGGDVQSIRPPYGHESVQTTIRSTLWFSMNTVPRFKTWDRATRVRLTPFPFNETFYDPGTAPEGGQEKDPNLAQWLASDAGQEALALYAVEGAKRYYSYSKDGKPGNFPNSAAVEALRDEILKTANPFADLFDDMLVFDPAMDTMASAITALLEEHFGRRPKQFEKELFLNALTGAGVHKQTIKVQGVRFLRGVGLTPAGEKAVAKYGVQCATRRRSAVVRPIVMGV